MGNSESFDLISISDLKNSSNTTNNNTKTSSRNTKKKYHAATHHQHAQSISAAITSSITSFDLNGIFRRLSDDLTGAYPPPPNISESKNSTANVVVVIQNREGCCSEDVLKKLKIIQPKKIEKIRILTPEPSPS